MIEIADGEHKEYVLQLTRVAWSVYGRVTNLKGAPIAEGTVIAEGQGKSEKSTLKNDGSFRIMGLAPAEVYSIRVESTLIEKTLPQTLSFEIPRVSGGQRG